MKTVLRHILSLPVIVLAATLFLSCSDDKETDQPAVPELGVVQDEYPTSADGGEHTIRITAKNIAGWNFRAPDQWIECSRLESENILMVTVDPNESTDPRTAEITIYADGAEDVVVKINQDAGVPVIPDAQVIWDNNSRFFAKLLGPAASVNFVEDMGDIELVEFNKGGYVTRMTTDMGGGSLVTTYDYDAQNRLERIGFFNNTTGLGIGMSIVINYTDEHNNYVDIGHTFLGGLEFVKAFQPRFMKGVSSVETSSLGEGTYTVNYIFAGLDMRVEDSGGNLLGIATYGVDGFAESQTNYLGTTYEGVDYNVDFHEVYDIDSQTGKYRTITYTEEWTPVDPVKGEAKTEGPYVETYLDDKYNNKHKEGTTVVFTYDLYGDFLEITSPSATDSYTYTRDAHNNWTKRVDNSVFMGDTYVITDSRTIKYYVK